MRPCRGVTRPTEVTQLAGDPAHLTHLPQPQALNLNSRSHWDSARALPGLDTQDVRAMVWDPPISAVITFTTYYELIMWQALFYELYHRRGLAHLTPESQDSDPAPHTAAKSLYASWPMHLLDFSKTVLVFSPMNPGPPRNHAAHTC